MGTLDRQLPGEVNQADASHLLLPVIPILPLVWVLEGHWVQVKGPSPLGWLVEAQAARYAQVFSWVGYRWPRPRDLLQASSLETRRRSRRHTPDNWKLSFVLVAAFKALATQLLVIAGIIAGCSLVVWLAGGQAAVVGLIATGVVGMKGPWVWTFGYGLASFVRDRGRHLPAILDGILVPNEVTAAAAASIERSTWHRHAWPYTVPITLLGVALTAVYGIPNTGIAYSLIFVGVCSIYYVAAFLLQHFVAVTMAFHNLLERMDGVAFRKMYSPLHLENLTTYLSVTTALGMVAIYAGFRGTLTAGFQFRQEVWRAFLSTPVVLFLPGTLLYNYYPRYVLRKIVQHKVFRTMERLSTAADDAGAKSLLVELRECGLLNAQILPFLDYKSLPSYLLAVFFALSLAYNSDPAVKAFVKYVVNFGSH